MKNKGFTLVEVLAAITVIALIALIATPVVNFTIKRMRKATFTRSADGLLKTTINYYTDNQADIINERILEFKCENNQCLPNVVDGDLYEKLNYTGKLGHGKVTIDEDGNISFDITDDVYCAYKFASDNQIYVDEGNCDSKHVIHDVIAPKIRQTDVSNEVYAIKVDYEIEENGSGIKEVICKYGEEEDNLNKLGSASETTCNMRNLSSSQLYYYEICAVDNGRNVSKPCVTGSMRTKAAIAGTPVILASWPNPTSMTVTIEEGSMTIDESDTISYQYSIAPASRDITEEDIKQVWLANGDSYTFTGLTEGTEYKVLVETKATNGGDLGNINQSNIYTSKTVIDTANGFTTSATCASSTKDVAATDIYNGQTLTTNVSSCSTYTISDTSACTKNTTTSSSSGCSGSISCSQNGFSGTINLSREVNNSTSYRDCRCSSCTMVHTYDDDCDYDYHGSRGCNVSIWHECSCSNPGGYGQSCSGSHPGCIHWDTGSCSCRESCSTVTNYSYTCYYSGTLTATRYEALYSGVVTPKQTRYVVEVNS